jgi:hypothetical protein
LNGVAEILPAKNPYTKKIVVLINELDFSAAEFLAAILQDNKRATLFGESTGGWRLREANNLPEQPRRRLLHHHLDDGAAHERSTD